MTKTHQLKTSKSLQTNKQTKNQVEKLISQVKQILID